MLIQHQFQYQSKYNTLLVFIILQNMYFILKIVCKENSYSFTCTVWLSHCDLITFSAPVFQCVSCSKKIFALCLRRKSKTSFLCLNSPKPFVLNVTISLAPHNRPWQNLLLTIIPGWQLKEGVGRRHSPWPTVAENGPNTQCVSTDSDLSNWEKYKPQQVVRVPNAVSVVYIVNWQVQRQAIVKTHRVGPRGPTTRERERVWPIYGVILNVAWSTWNVALCGT